MEILKNLIFVHERVGKDGKIFRLYKFRTMYPGAHRDQKKYLHLNEADGPVFKIRDDPRYTGFGRWLAVTGLDEVLQIVNIIRGEMNMVGPRPLPPEEEKKIPDKWRLKRRLVKPGITSSWVVKGGHKLSFAEWMKYDLEDIRRKSFWYDIGIALQTIRMVAGNVVHLAFTAGIDKPLWWFLPLLVFPLIDQGYFSAPFVWLAVCLSLLVGWIGSGKNKIPYPRTLFILWMGFLGVGVVATARALSPPWSVLGLVYVASAFLASVAGAMVQSSKARKGAIFGIIGSSVVLSLLTLADVLGVIPTGVLPAFALYRVNSGHALSASYLLFALPILLIYRPQSRKGKWVHILSAAIIFTAFLFSFARGAFIGALAELLYLGVVGSPDIRKIARVGVLGMVFWLLLLSQPTIIATLFPRFPVSQFLISRQSWARLVYKPVNLEQRGEYWRIGSVAIRERPLTGWGFGAYRFLMTRFRNSVGVYSDSAHNFYLETAVETGLIGGALFAILLVWSLGVSFTSWSRTKDRQALAISAGLLGSAMSAFVGYEWVFPSVFWLFWFLVGVAARRTAPPAASRNFKPTVVVICVLISLWGVLTTGGMLPYLHPRVAEEVLTTIVTHPFVDVEPSLRWIDPIFRADRGAQLMLSSWYERQNRKAEAIVAAQAAYWADPLNLVTFRWFHQLLVEDGQVQRARVLEDEILARLRTDRGDAFGLKDQGNRKILLELAREDCKAEDCRRGIEIYRILFEL